jgi:hypothetical protein
MERTRNAGWSCPSAPLGFSFHFFRATARIVSFFTMSNSVVFFVPAACYRPRVRCFRFVRIFRPQPRGGGAPETGHWHFRRACEARRLTSRATGGRLSALQRGDFRRRDRRFIFRQCPPESAPRLRLRPDARKRPADRVPYLPSRGSLRSPGRHSPAPPSGHLRRRPS